MEESRVLKEKEASLGDKLTKFKAVVNSEKKKCIDLEKDSGRAREEQKRFEYENTALKIEVEKGVADVAKALDDPCLEETIDLFIDGFVFLFKKDSFLLAHWLDPWIYVERMVVYDLGDSRQILRVPGEYAFNFPYELNCLLSEIGVDGFPYFGDFCGVTNYHFDFLCVFHQDTTRFTRDLDEVSRLHVHDLIDGVIIYLLVLGNYHSQIALSFRGLIAYDLPDAEVGWKFHF